MWIQQNCIVFIYNPQHKTIRQFYVNIYTNWASKVRTVLMLRLFNTNYLPDMINSKLLKLNTECTKINRTETVSAVVFFSIRCATTFDCCHFFVFTISFLLEVSFVYNTALTTAVKMFIRSRALYPVIRIWTCGWAKSVTQSLHYVFRNLFIKSCLLML